MLECSMFMRKHVIQSKRKITDGSWGKDKETIRMAFYRPLINYATPIWTLNWSTQKYVCKGNRSFQKLLELFTIFCESK